MTTLRIISTAIALTTSFLCAIQGYAQAKPSSENPYAFTQADIAFLKNFSVSALPPLPDAPGNKFADDLAAAKLGRQIFFDKRLGKNGRFSCASCHQPERHFTDGLAVGKANGTSQRSTPTLVGVGWSPWQYWDGRKDSLWSQALAPIEDHNEMATDRSDFVKKLLRHYAEQYESVFGKPNSEISTSKFARKLPRKASPTGDKKSKRRWQKMTPELQDAVNRAFTNAGKALMAYQRKIRVQPSRFDFFIDDLVINGGRSGTSLLNKKEVEGLRLFMGRANCASCHNGPLFTNFEFHNIGAPEADPSNVDLGRYTGVKALTEDEFTCLSKWSDAKEAECEEMTFLKRSGPELVGALKTPTLRSIALTAPYMQAGQLKTLPDVISHYSTPVPPFYDREQHPNRPHFDILPLKLNAEEMNSIVAFLTSLSAPYPEHDFWWNPKIKTLKPSP